MNDFGAINELKEKIKKTRISAAKIQSAYRTYRDTLHAKKEMLSTVLWEKEKADIFRRCCEKKTARGT